MSGGGWHYSPRYHNGVGKLDEIGLIVMADPDLMKSLTEATTEAQLFADVIALGLKHGVQLTPEELAEVIRANRRTWFERWLDL